MSIGSFSQAGFYYQNNVAALKILGLLDISSDLLNVSLENYDKGKHIDDIILTKAKSIDFFQVKWSNEITKAYTIHNLAFQVPEGSDKSLWKKLADGYASKITDGKKASIILYSPRIASNSKSLSKGIDKGLQDLIAFQTAFRNGLTISLEDIPKYKEFKPLLSKLKNESGLSEEDFIDFFKTLYFNLGAPELEYIKLQLENKANQLGLEETQIIKLLDLVVQWSISGVAVTKDKLLQALGIRDRFVDRLSQVFKIDEANYVENTDLFKKLDSLINSINNGYVYIEGVPGAGKSTALTKYASQNKHIRFSYYCFIPDETTTKELRLKGEYFLKSLCIAIEKGFPEVDLPIRYSENYEDKLSQYFDKISALGEKIVFLIDGLDHVDRNKEVLNNPLTNNILSALPDNLIVIISSQYIEALPPSIRAEISNDDNRHIKLSRFSESQTRIYLNKKSLFLTNEEINLLHEKSEGIPLYLRYITSLLEDSEPKEYITVINEFPKLVDSKINTYHSLLYHRIESDIVAKWILSLLANRKEYTSIEVLKTILEIADVSYNILQISHSLKSYKHLLKEKEGVYYTIFHNSFREFIISNTQEIRAGLNMALAKYYETDIFQEEAFRNYFSHLAYLGEHKKIVEIVNQKWINESWKRYKSISEIIENINISWNSCVQIGSISEFVRVAFLKHQMDYASFNLSNGNFEESTYFLEAGLTKESFRTIWDGEFAVIANEDFFNHYAIKYYELTGNVIPFSIATQFFSTFLNKATSKGDQQAHGKDRPDFGPYLKAKSLYLKPQELNDEIYSLREHLDLDDLKSLIQFFNSHNKLAWILELWQLFKEGSIKNYALSELLLGLWEQKNSDAVNYEVKFSFDLLEESDKINFLENIISNTSEVVSIEKYKPISIEPFFDEEIISPDYDYKLKPEFLNLLQTLKVFYFLDEANYALFELKLSSLPQYPRTLYFALSSCAKIWAIQKKYGTKESVLNDCKKIIDDLTIPEYLASMIISEHGAKSFIKYHIYKINEVVFKCFTSICSNEDIRQLVPYWLEKHDKNGFYDYQSDLAFAHAI
ncbi:MAG: NACHT domain-containing protein, partial [bacterium]